jgi:hypothetical protein
MSYQVSDRGDAGTSLVNANGRQTLHR